MKAGFLPVVPIRHQAVLAGRVTDESTGQPLAHASVTLSGTPPALKQRLRVLAGVRGQTWESLSERPDRTRTALDGSYRFVDLPPGSYELTVEVSGAKYQKTISSAEVSKSGTGEIQLKLVNIQVARAT